MEPNKLGRSIATPQRLITNEIEQLDIILNILNDNEQRPHTDKDIFNDRYFRESKSYILPKDLILAIEKLCLDKYVDKINADWRNEIERSQNVPIPDYYRITYSGRMFLSNTWRIFNKRPYREGRMINNWKTIWTITKTITSAAITIIVVTIGILGLIISDKTDKLQQTIDDQIKTIETQSFKVDSLIKVTNDTTRLRKR